MSEKIIKILDITSFALICAMVCVSLVAWVCGIPFHAAIVCLLSLDLAMTKGECASQKRAMKRKEAARELVEGFMYDLGKVHGMNAQSADDEKMYKKVAYYCWLSQQDNFGDVAPSDDEFEKVWQSALDVVEGEICESDSE